MTGNEKAPPRNGAKVSSEPRSRRQLDNTTCGCECQQVLVDQIASASALLDRQEAAIDALERGFAAMLSRMSQAVIEKEIHRTLDEAERNRGRK